MSLSRLLRRLHANRSGVAMLEFALGAPFMLAAGLGGTEMANYALVNMKVGQLAVHYADNASRIGDTSTLQNRRIYESDINDLIVGAQIQAGSLDIYEHGRVIISSLQAEAEVGGDQIIGWQRCRGKSNIPSSYGDEGDAMPDGMGPDGEEVTAEPGDAVIFVELHYTYQPLIADSILGLEIVSDKEISSISSFTVRDSRDLTQIYQRDPDQPDPVQRCNVFTGNVAIAKDGGVS